MRERRNAHSNHHRAATCRLGYIAIETAQGGRTESVAIGPVMEQQRSGRTERPTLWPLLRRLWSLLSLVSWPATDASLDYFETKSVQQTLNWQEVRVRTDPHQGRVQRAICGFREVCNDRMCGRIGQSYHHSNRRESPALRVNRSLHIICHKSRKDLVYIH